MIFPFLFKGGEHLMSGTSSDTAQVLGASATAIGGIAALPNTGGGFIFQVLPYLAIILGASVLASFAITRLIRKLA